MTLIFFGGGAGVKRWDGKLCVPTEKSWLRPWPCPYTHPFGHQNTNVMVLIWWSTTTGLKLSSILHRHILCTALYPDIYLSMKICMQRKAGRRKQTKLCLSVFSFPWSLVLHHQSPVCHSHFTLAPVWKTRCLRRRKFFVDTNLFGSFSFLLNKR